MDKSAYNEYMFDAITLGTVSVDLFFRDDSLTFHDNRFQLSVGGKYQALYFHTSVGGGAANIAIHIQRQGLQAAVMGKIGENPFKRLILDSFEKESVFYKYCHYEKDYYNISSILLTPTGERTVIHHQTPHQHLFESEKEMKRLRRAKAVYVGTIPDGSLSIREEILAYLKQHDVLSIVNLGIRDCRRNEHALKTILNRARIIIVNGHEFAEIVKAPYQDIDFTEHVVDYYIPYLKDQLVIITEGERGSYAYYAGHVIHQKAIKPNKIVDTTGAGDAYCAGFIASYLQTNDIQSAMKNGAELSSKVLSKVGAT